MEDDRWAAPDPMEWRFDPEQRRLGFMFGARCACWIELSLTDDELARCQGPDKRAIEALIADVERNEARYRPRLSL